MIELQTGLPGACKSLYTIDRIEVIRKRENRPVFYIKREQGDDTAPGIVELTLPWTPITVEEWPSCPAGSIVVIDECQKVPGFRPRPTAQAAPVWAEPAMETHRGKGIDLILICQHPSQLHVGIRRLVGRHLHAVRKFGMPVSTIHEWGAVKDACDKSRSDSQQTLYRFNKHAYKYYKSAEAHTHKIKIPRKVIALGLIVLAVPLMGYWAFNQAFGFGKHVKTPTSSAASGEPGASGTGAAPVLTPAQYAQQYTPRIAGLPHTAPAYDEVTRPTEAPYPAACVSMPAKKLCRCYTQQGTRLDTAADLCEQIAAGGFFVAWRQQVVQGVPLQQQETPTSPSHGAVVALNAGDIRQGLGAGARPQ